VCGGGGGSRKLKYPAADSKDKGIHCQSERHYSCVCVCVCVFVCACVYARPRMCVYLYKGNL